jgi:hypothetical protein
VITGHPLALPQSSHQEMGTRPDGWTHPVPHSLTARWAGPRSPSARGGATPPGGPPRSSASPSGPPSPASPPSAGAQPASQPPAGCCLPRAVVRLKRLKGRARVFWAAQSRGDHARAGQAPRLPGGGGAGPAGGAVIYAPPCYTFLYSDCPSNVHGGARERPHRRCGGPQ